MDLDKAIKIMQIPKGINLTDDYLKKRYRYIAVKVHPDKFIDPRKKISAHRNFIKLKDAYEYLLSIDYKERLKYSEKHTSENIKSNKSENEETDYQLNKDYNNWLFYILLPGYMFYAFILMFLIMSWYDIVNENFKEKKIINIIVATMFFITFSLFISGFFSFTYSKLLSGNWLGWVLSFELVFGLFYFLLNTIRWKFFIKKSEIKISEKS